MGCPVASEADKKRTLAGVSFPAEGVQSPQGQLRNQSGQGNQSDQGNQSGQDQSGNPPLLVAVSPEELVVLIAKCLVHSDCLRPALVLALDPIESESESSESSSSQPSSVAWLRQLGQGPVARIITDDSAVILQEAEAALRCIWPDLSVN